MSADLAVQKAIRARLVGATDVTDLVLAASILDRNQRPAPDPSIVLGESQEIDAGTIDRARTEVFHTVHVWKREPSLEGVKRIASAIIAALKDGRLDIGPAYHAADWKVSSARTMRDPDGETSHGIITVEVLACEVAP